MKKKKNTLKKLFFGSVGFSLIVLIAFATHLYQQVKQYDEVFASNVWVNDIPIGQLSHKEAFDKLTLELLPTLDHREITLLGEENSSPVKLTYAQLGVHYNLDEVLGEATLIGHEGNVLERYQALKKPSSSPVHFTLTPKFDLDQVKTYIQPLLEAFYKAPIDAKMERKDRAFHITPEAVGYAADLDATLQQVEALLSQNSVGTIDVPLVPIAPTYSASYLKELQIPLSSFSTSYNNSDTKRNMNIELASKKINTMLMPNEKFMFSKQLEPITTAAGYQSAKVINNGNFEEGIGGGICQVSSTLYNALILTDIDIYMRRNHSLPVSYTPLGMDATYATDSVDFQFINNTGHPLYIESYCENNKVYVTIYGHKDFKPSYTAKFESVVDEVIAPPPVRYEEDPTLSPGTQVQKVRPKSGHKVSLYKLYYKNNELIKKEKINTSIYKAQGEVIRRGPTPPPKAPLVK